MSGEEWWFNDSSSDQIIWRFSGFYSNGNIIGFEVAGPKANSTTVIFKPVLRIGRDPSRCDIVIMDQTVSRLHAEIHFIPGEGIVIRDMGSANGTFVDGKPISHEFHPIGIRSSLTLGRLQLAVSVRL
jgi:pSer/pThr/pTyr-binding forkhead associated (FHA) protein